MKSLVFIFIVFVISFIVSLVVAIEHDKKADFPDALVLLGTVCEVTTIFSFSALLFCIFC